MHEHRLPVAAVGAVARVLGHVTVGDETVSAMAAEALQLVCLQRRESRPAPRRAGHVDVHEPIDVRDQCVTLSAADQLGGHESIVARAAHFARVDVDPPASHPRIGLAAGPAVSLHGDYYGEVVNLAAQLVEAAEASQIMVSDSLRHAVGDRFGFEHAPELVLKGFELPVPAYRLRPTVQ